MSNDRFFVEQCAGEVIQLPESETRHALKSKRLSVGDQIVLFDGKGNETIGQIASASHREVTVAPETVIHQPRRTPALTLFVAPPKGSRQDTLIEKCTELGVASIQPLACERSIADVSAHRLNKWRRTTIEAAKQSGQAWLPELHLPTTLQAALADTARFDCTLAAISLGNRDTTTPASITDLLPQLRKADKIAAFIGPEGGWTNEEIDMLTAAHTLAVSFGPNTLRIETAAVVIASMVHALYDGRM